MNLISDFDECKVRTPAIIAGNSTLMLLTSILIHVLVMIVSAYAKSCAITADGHQFDLSQLVRAAEDPWRVPFTYNGYDYQTLFNVCEQLDTRHVLFY